MIRPSQNSILLRICHSLFLRTTNPPFMEFTMLTLQFLSYVVLVETSLMTPVADSASTRIVIMVALILMPVIRSISGLTIIRIFYIPFGYYLYFQPSDFSIYISYVLILLNLFLDLVAKTEFSYCSENINAQTNNFCKLLHYTFMIAATWVQTSEQIIKEVRAGVVMGLMFVMLGARWLTIMRNEQFQNLHLQFYTLLFFYSLLGLLAVWVNILPFYYHLGAIALALTLQLYFYRPHKLSIFEHITRGTILEACYYILRYKYSNHLKPQYEKELIKEEPNFLTYPPHSKRMLPSRLLSSLSNDQVKPIILRAQLALYEQGNFTKAKLLAKQAHDACPWYGYWDYLIIYHFEERMYRELDRVYRIKQCSNFEEYMESAEFIVQLFNSTVSFVNLWQYTQVSEPAQQKLYNLACTYTQHEQAVTQSYKQLKLKQLSVMATYIAYAYRVNRGTELANKLIDQLCSQQELLDNLQLEEKVYLRLSLEPSDILQLQKVGLSATKMIGFERSQLEGVNHTIILPEFLEAEHFQWAQKMISEYPEKLSLFSKRTIVKTFQGHYKMGQLCLKMDYSYNGQLFLHGYFQLLTLYQYDWKTFLMVKALDGEIIEQSKSMQNFLYTSEEVKHNAFDLFGVRNIRQSQLYTNGQLEWRMVPLLEIKSQRGLIVYMVKEIPKNQENQQWKGNQFKRKMGHLPYFELTSQIDHYFKVKRELLAQIMNSKAIFVILGLLLMVLAGIAIQAYTIESTKASSLVSQTKMMVLQQLLTQYFSLCQIILGAHILNLNTFYNVDFQLYKKLDIVGTVLLLQESNYQLRRFAHRTYTLDVSPDSYKYEISITNYNLVMHICSQMNLIEKLQPKFGVSLLPFILSKINLEANEAINEYRDFYLEDINENTSLKQVQTIILLIVITILLFSSYAFLLFLERLKRTFQLKTLQLLGSVSFQDNLLASAKQFLFTLTQQEYVSNLISNCNAAKIQQNKDQPASGLVSRDNSVRNFINEPTENGFEGIQDKEKQRVLQFTIQKWDKRVTLLPLVVIAAIMGVHIGYSFYSSLSDKFDLDDSTVSIINFIKKPVQFMICLNNYLNMIYSGKEAKFKLALSQFETIEKEVQEFPQTQLPQFAVFRQDLSNLRYNYLCNYVQCNPEYAQEINIIYSTTMRKYINFMIQNTNQSVFENPEFFVLLYSSKLLKDVVVTMLQHYTDNYNIYQNNTDDIQNAYSITAIVLLIILFFGYIAIWLWLRMKKKCIILICGIVREDGYKPNQIESSMKGG